MSVMVGTKVKNAGYWLPRFTRQIEGLEGDVSRVVCMYGESTDNSLSLLRHWRDTSKHRIEIYKEPYLPVEERFEGGLARIKRDLQKLLKEGGEEYFAHFDCDLVQIPKDALIRLIARGKDLIAGMVWVEGREQPTFFDTFMFRKGGCMFHPFDPPGMGASEPLMVDAVGTFTVSTSEAELAVPYSNPYPRLIFCKQLRDRGFNVWLDPTVHAYHIDLERLGINHYPHDMPFTNVPFITSKGVKVPTAYVTTILRENKRDSYSKWITETYPEEACDVASWLHNRPLLTASYKVFNEERFLKYSLESVYPYVDRIDIIEGAEKQSLPYAKQDGSSRDSTVQIIRDFPDPECKIRLVQGVWKSREHAQAKLLEMCLSKWMLYVDGDEVYDSVGMEKTRSFCMSHQDGSVVYARPERFHNFWHDFRHVVYSLDPMSPFSNWGLPHAWLIWRDVPGLNFDDYHIIARDVYGDSVSLDNRRYRKRQAVIDGVSVYHFGNAKGADAVQYKLQSVHPRMLGDAEVDPWFSGEMPVGLVLERFKGKLPKLLRGHPDFGKQKIRIMQKKPTYKFEMIT